VGFLVEVAIVVVKTTTSHGVPTWSICDCNTAFPLARGFVGGAPHSCLLAVPGVASQPARAKTGVALELVAVRESLLEGRQLVEAAVVVVHAASHQGVASSTIWPDDTSTVGPLNMSFANEWRRFWLVYHLALMHPAPIDSVAAEGCVAAVHTPDCVARHCDILQFTRNVLPSPTHSRTMEDVVIFVHTPDCVARHCDLLEFTTDVLPVPTHSRTSEDVVIFVHTPDSVARHCDLLEFTTDVLPDPTHSRTSEDVVISVHTPDSAARHCDLLEFTRNVLPLSICDPVNRVRIVHSPEAASRHRNLLRTTSRRPNS